MNELIIYLKFCVACELESDQDDSSRMTCICTEINLLGNKITRAWDFSGQIRKYCFLVMFPNGGQTWQHCFLAMFPKMEALFPQNITCWKTFVHSKGDA